MFGRGYNAEQMELYSLVQQLSRQVQHLNNQVAQIRLEQPKIQQEIRSLENDFHGAKNGLSNKEVELEQLSADLAHLKANLEFLKDENESLRKEVGQKQEACEQIRQEYDDQRLVQKNKLQRFEIDIDVMIRMQFITKCQQYNEKLKYVVGERELVLSRIN
eukprot:TRINITY_DN4358_c0_g1_i3.p1 TRINITY_DN4358_c0_g1~~TRINITY_DN4358_c0_g1_i3.p1  ORF type:complete len:161 (+),score=16.48 TRINITY_DN4358_c0_g1_i3:124-606(+)